MKRLFALVFLAASAFSQAAYAQAKVDKPKLEAYIRRLELLIPAVTIKIDDPVPAAYLKGYSEVIVHFSYNGQGKDERYMVSSDGATLIRGEAFDLKRSPFQSTIDRMKTEGEPSYGGGANAPVTLVQYVDLECPYCKAQADMVGKNMVKAFGDKVRVVFRDFPIDEPHPWARAAHIAARCVFRQDEKKFWAFHDWIFANQADFTVENLGGRIDKWATDNRLKAPDFGTCVSTKATAAEVAQSVQEGLSLGVSVTPTAFLNGSKLEGSIEWNVLEQFVKIELDRLGK